MKCRRKGKHPYKSGKIRICSGEKYPASRDFFENACVGFYVCDPDGTIRDINQAALSLLGRTRQQIIGKKKLCDLVVPDQRRNFKSEWTDFQKNIKVCRFRYSLAHSKGHPIHVNITRLIKWGKTKKPTQIFGAIIDITQHVQLAETLLREKEKAQQYLDIVGTIIVSLNPKGQVTLINNEGCRILGFPREKILGKVWWDHFLPSQNRAEIRSVFSKLIQGKVKKIEYFENPILTRTGEQRIIRWHNNVIRDHSGKITGTLGAGEDITERKKTENLASIQHDLNYRLSGATDLKKAISFCVHAAMQSSQMDAGGVYLLDKKTFGLKLIYSQGLSSAFIKAASYHPADAEQVRLVMCGRPVYVSYAKKGFPTPLQSHLKGIKTLAVIPLLHEGSVIGSLNVVSYKVSQISPTDQNSLETIASEMGNAIARLMMEEAFRESERRYSDLVVGAPDPIIILDMNGCIRSMNPAFQKLCNIPEKQILGLSFGKMKILAPPSVLLMIANFAMAIRGKNPRPYELEFINKEKGSVYFEANMRAIRQQGKVVGAQMILRNITERRIAERKVKETNLELIQKEKKIGQALEELKKANQELHSTQLQLLQATKMEAVGRLAAGLAHEVKNPLAIAVAGLEYLSKNTKIEGQSTSVFTEICYAIKRADTVIKELLNFSAARKLDITTENLNLILKKTLTLVDYYLRKNHVVLKENLSPQTPKVSCDPDKMGQVFLNVIMNAINAMPKGGTLNIKSYPLRLKEDRLVTGSESKEVLRKGETVAVVEIEDTGVGIPPDKIGKVFDPFFTVMPVGQGTGLGLTVSQKIIQLHKGIIQIANKKEKGVRVTIMLKV